jgi:hypothetical protein
MTAVRGKIRKGKVVLDKPVRWPDGCAVMVELVDPVNTNGIRDEDWPTTKEGIAALLKQMDEVQPFEWTEEERAAFHQSLQKQKAFELSRWKARSKKIARLFE